MAFGHQDVPGIATTQHPRMTRASGEGVIMGMHPASDVMG
jgi:hypothetical protein